MATEPANGRADRAEQFELAVDGLKLPTSLHWAGPADRGVDGPHRHLLFWYTDANRFVLTLDATPRCHHSVASAHGPAAAASFVATLHRVQRGQEVGQAC